MRSAYVYTTDERGLALTRFSIVAAMLTQPADVEFFIFCTGFHLNKNDSLINAATKLGRTLDVRYFDLIDGNPTRTHVTATAKFKVRAIDDLYHIYDRLLYLDGDVLLIEDINLNNISFDGYPIAAVYDIAQCAGLTDYTFGTKVDIEGHSHHYFNSGIIAVNCEQWQTEFVASYKEIDSKHGMSCPYRNDCKTVDQCVWNLLFEKNWKRLPLSFNCQACCMFSEYWKYSRARHYVGAKKFWHVNPFRNDARDIALLKRCASILGTRISSKWWYPIARWLNIVRNRHYNSIVLNAISYIDGLYAEEM